MKHTYKPLPDIVTINKSEVHGLGLFSTKHIDEGAKIGVTLFFTAKFGHIRTPLGGFVNHSDDPNCFVMREDDTLVLYAAENIEDRVELTINYLTLPYLCEDPDITTELIFS